MLLKGLENMLEGPKKTGSIKILNNGVDVAIVIAQGEANEVMRASRILAVRGVSVAVLEETCFDPMDVTTLHFYKKRVQFFAGVGVNVVEAIRSYIGSETRIVLLKKNDAAYIVANVEEVIRTQKSQVQLDSKYMKK